MASKTPKIRNLGQVGVNTDVDPFDLPTNGISFAQNVRFYNNRISSGPVYKTVVALPEAAPRYLASITLDTTADQVYLGFASGDTYQLDTGATLSLVNASATFTGTIAGTVLTVTAFSTSTVAGISPGMALTGAGVTAGTTITGFGDANTFGGLGTYNLSKSSTVSTAETLTAAYVPVMAGSAVWTSCHLGDLTYINRSDRTPWWISSTTPTFVDLAGTPAVKDDLNNIVGWQPTWSCQVLRACGDALVALGMTEGGVVFPTKLRTSSFVTEGNTPSSWDTNDPSTNATSNILAEMEGPITDACALGNNLIIYSPTQAWIMVPDLVSGSVWDFSQLPFQKGALAANCSVQINSRNYVFGQNDIWMHDGVTEQSICDQRVRNFVFQSMDLSNANLCHIVHNQELKEIAFCFLSADQFVQFPVNPNTPNACNRAAVYSYANDNWTFDSLPYVFGSARANIDSNSEAWDTTTRTWTQESGTWLSEEDNAKRCVIQVGDAVASLGLTPTLYAHDIFGNGGVTGFPVNTSATPFPFIQRTGIDLDEIGGDLVATKQVNYLVPQGRFDVNNPVPLQITMGASDGYNDPIRWGLQQPYDGNTNFKIDGPVQGRFLSLEISFNDFHQFTLSGFDMDVIETGMMR